MAPISLIFLEVVFISTRLKKVQDCEPKTFTKQYFQFFISLSFPFFSFQFPFLSVFLFFYFLSFSFLFPFHFPFLSFSPLFLSFSLSFPFLLPFPLPLPPIHSLIFLFKDGREAWDEDAASAHAGVAQVVQARVGQGQGSMAQHDCLLGQGNQASGEYSSGIGHGNAHCDKVGAVQVGVGLAPTGKLNGSDLYALVIRITTLSLLSLVMWDCPSISCFPPPVP